MSGMEMMLVNMLKAFMPKEAAEKIAGYATDGTFDRIGAIPSELDAIKESLARIELAIAGVGRRQVALLHHQSEGADQVSRVADGSGLEPAPFAEYGANGVGNGAGTSGSINNGHAGDTGPLGVS